MKMNRKLAVYIRPALELLCKLFAIAVCSLPPWIIVMVHLH